MIDKATQETSLKIHKCIIWMYFENSNIFIMLFTVYLITYTNNIMKYVQMQGIMSDLIAYYVKNDVFNISLHEMLNQIKLNFIFMRAEIILNTYL